MVWFGELSLVNTCKKSMVVELKSRVDTFSQCVCVCVCACVCVRACAHMLSPVQLCDSIDCRPLDKANLTKYMYKHSQE